MYQKHYLITVGKYNTKLYFYTSTKKGLGSIRKQNKKTNENTL